MDVEINRQSDSTTERQMDRRRTDTKVDRLIDRHTCRHKYTNTDREKRDEKTERWMDRKTDRFREGWSDRQEGVVLLYFPIFPVTRLSLVWRKIHCNQSWHGPFQRLLRPKTKKSFALMGLSLARSHTHTHTDTHTHTHSVSLSLSLSLAFSILLCLPFDSVVPIIIHFLLGTHGLIATETVT